MQPTFWSSHQAADGSLPQLTHYLHWVHKDKKFQGLSLLQINNFRWSYCFQSDSQCQWVYPKTTILQEIKIRCEWDKLQHYNTSWDHHQGHFLQITKLKLHFRSNKYSEVPVYGDCRRGRKITKSWWFQFDGERILQNWGALWWKRYD